MFCVPNWAFVTQLQEGVITDSMFVTFLSFQNKTTYAKKKQSRSKGTALL